VVMMTTRERYISNQLAIHYIADTHASEQQRHPLPAADLVRDQATWLGNYIHDHKFRNCLLSAAVNRSPFKNAGSMETAATSAPNGKIGKSKWRLELSGPQGIALLPVIKSLFALQQL